ncbi:signal recognition particle-docking protein FtsY, partial [Pseudomonas corrugata]|nr:signal recognition particle-docking protein FtsY [Pseudomonas corrugata]
MFGSNDDKKTPAEAGEKKGLFGWLRKKPQETVVEQPQPLPEPAAEPAAEAVAEDAAPIVLPLAEPVLQPAEPEPVTAPAAEQPLTPPVGQSPWLTLPVAEEPVALVEDAQAPHVTPPIPAPTPAVAEPVV